jgi:uncharacterized protein YggE
MLKLVPLSLVALAVPALADTTPPPRIMVTGSGSVFTPPDLAVITYRVHGEGQTSDDAVGALVAKRKAVDAGMRGLVEEPARGGEISIRDVRSRDCSASNYGQPQLSTGACAIIGYVADLQLEIRTRNVAKAATAAGLIGRLGGSDPRVAAFILADPRPAQRRAMAAALADAKVRAQAIADGAGVRLGPIQSVSDGNRIETPEEIVVTASAPPPPPPPPPPVYAPITVDVTPRPIETEARANVVYQIMP